jgi:hypothetical protein
MLKGLPGRASAPGCFTRCLSASPALALFGKQSSHASPREFDVFRYAGNMPQWEQLIHSSRLIASANSDAMIVMVASFIVRTLLR